MSTNKTIDDLTGGAAVSGTDKIAVWQGAGPTTSITATNLATFLGVDTVGATEVAVGTGTALTGTAAFTFGSNVLTIDGVVNGLAGIEVNSTTTEEAQLTLSVDGGAALASNTGTGLSIYASGDCDLGEIGINVLAFDQATGKFTFPAIASAPNVVMTSGAASVIIFPTSDPMVVGAWWNDSGVLTLSAAT